MIREDLRNVAIIAHVDHGKTTLVDALLKQSNTFRDADAQGTTIMDSNELERERGITIFSKNAEIEWKGKKINVVDTPGHADFGGEVERIMNLVNGCLLLVDAQEGPMPQTKFVLKKALEAGHRVIVVINKVDKPASRPDWVLDKTFDLFVDLGATDAQADFPVVYASAINGVAGKESDINSMKDITPILDEIVDEVPGPEGDSEKPFQMGVVNIFYDNYKGRMAVGRIINGKISTTDQITHVDRDGKRTPAKLSILQMYKGLGREDVKEAFAGDIITVAGIPEVQIGDSIIATEGAEALPVLEIEQPTVRMTFGTNTSPFAGTEGEFTTSRHVKERLEKELLNDVALRVEAGEGDGQFMVSGRGELHLAILIEKMRREGYELQVSRPQVIFKEVDGEKMEPYEEVTIECPEIASGLVIEKMSKRRGEMKDMRVENGTTHLHFEIPTRGLIGYRNEFITDTKGEGTLNTLLLGYRPHAGKMGGSSHGSLISMEKGKTITYALSALQQRGTLFVGPGVEVYVGMVVGQNSRLEDMDVNPIKEKKLTNHRSSGDGVGPRLEPAKEMTLEMSMEFIGDDELLEITPKNLRIRKTILDANVRKRAASSKK
jgi:GTP-binding protein